jgi:hypothetical protein
MRFTVAILSSTGIRSSRQALITEIPCAQQMDATRYIYYMSMILIINIPIIILMSPYVTIILSCSAMIRYDRRATAVIQCRDHMDATRIIEDQCQELQL